MVIDRRGRYSVSQGLKIVDVCEFFAERGGGVRTYVHQKLAAGARAGHQVVIVAPGPEDREEERLGGRVIWVKSPKMPLDPRYFLLYREAAVHEILDREAPDVLEGSSPWQGGWFAARWRGDALRAFIFHSDPVAVWPQTVLGHGLGPERVDRMFGFFWRYLQRLSGHYDVTVCSGQWLAAKLQRLQIPTARAVSFGIDKECFSSDKYDPELRRRLLKACGVGPEARLLVTVSRFHPEKRLGTIVGGFRRAAREEEMGLVIFGDGPLKWYFTKRYAKTKGICLAGFTRDREELATALASADAMVHGSAAETYGLVVAEAMCSGLPLVVPDGGGAADLARPEYSESYRAGDQASCARAITRLLARGGDELRAACEAAVTERVGTMDDHFTKLFALYENMLASRSGSGG